MRDLKLLLKFPTRGRREKFTEVLEIYLRTCSQNVIFLVSLDNDDPSMYDIERGRKEENIIWVRGFSNGKIHACNRDIEKVKDWDIVVLASDDMIPKRRDWDKRIIEEMNRHFPDTDGVLHFNDGYTQERLNTMCIVGRKYYNRFGYLYNPEYRSLFCDNEFMEVSQALGKAKYFPDVLFAHEHPANNGKVFNDHTYVRNNALYKYDQSTYYRRKAIRFGL